MAETKITMVKVRARVTLGSGSSSVVAETPGPRLTNGSIDGMIMSFTVNKERGRPSTFSAALKIRYDVLNGNSIGDVHIEAGTEEEIHTIFRGIVKSARISPCHDDPSFVLINLSGADYMSKLEGMKYTRRRRGTKVAWVTIDSVVRSGLRSGKFHFKRRDMLDMINTNNYEKGQFITGVGLMSTDTKSVLSAKFGDAPKGNVDINAKTKTNG